MIERTERIEAHWPDGGTYLSLVNAIHEAWGDPMADETARFARYADAVAVATATARGNEA